MYGLSFLMLKVDIVEVVKKTPFDSEVEDPVSFCKEISWGEKKWKYKFWPPLHRKSKI